jgi:hypothetical protein
MATTTASGTRLTLAEVDDRRLAVENTIGTLRIENIEADEVTKGFGQSRRGLGQDWWRGHCWR